MARRRLVIYFLIACAAVLAAAAVFLATFDANRYRTGIEALLSERLARRVSIGHIETDLLPEPVVVLSGLQIGNERNNFTFRADRLTLKPESWPLPLVTGKLHFHEIIAESPQLTATLGVKPPAEQPPEEERRPPPAFSVDRLTVNNASWRLVDKRRPESSRSYGGENLNLKATAITARQVESFEGTGILVQGDDSARLDLRGHIIPQGPDWRQSDIAFRIDTSPLGDDFLALLPLAGRTLKGPAALSLDLGGTAASGIHIKTRLQGEKLSLTRAGADQPLWSSDAVALSASLSLDKDRLRLQDLSMQAGSLSLNGRLLARQTAQGLLLEAELENIASPLALVHPGEFARKRRLRLDSAQLAALLAGVRLPGLEQGGAIEMMPQPDTLKFNGRGHLDLLGKNRGGDTPFRLSSTVSDIFAAEPALQVTLETTLATESLPDIMSKLKGDDVQVAGTTGIRLRLNGVPATINFDIQADLTNLELTSGQIFSKKRGMPGRLHLQGRRNPDGWEFGKSTLDLPPVTINAEGRLRRAERLIYDLSLNLRELDLADSGALFPILKRFEIHSEAEEDAFQATGTTGIRLRLNGTPATFNFDVDADLTDLELKSGQLFSKKRGVPGRLHLEGQRKADVWEFDESALDLPPVAINAQGRLRRADRLIYDLSFKLRKLDLAKAYSLFPILKRLGLHGELAGDLDLSPAGPKGAFRLSHVGLPIPGKLADLDHLSGTVTLSGKQLEAPTLHALLGESPIQLSLTVEDLKRPRFAIHLESPSVRASDLIFSNRQAFLRDLDADFVITGEGLHLVEVHTRLDGGTVARVEGTISPFSAPDTLLSIDAEYGNIDEVIALFQGPEDESNQGEKASQGNETDGKGGEVLIDITAQKGRFSSLEFTEAEGFLSIRQGLLSIHPLVFHSGTGYFTGMLLRDGSGKPPHSLQISGHFENFDADTLYRQQLKHEGIITGKLRGDFYLEGTEGKDEFLKSSRGTFNLEIEGGVLRKFKVLAKIFSILNVSQLFKFQLPDTSSRGMPYDKLTTTVRLRKGVLETDDLFVDSEAMDMTAVGSLNLISKGLDMTIGVKPLQTVDKIISKIPIAGWLLTGEEKALITTHFEVKGSTDDPKVKPIPISSVSDKAKGIFRRLFGLPEKIIEDVENIFD